MKILLINPPFEVEHSVGASKSIRYVLNVIPPLGLAYLSAVLEKEGFEVKIIDCTVGVSGKDLFKQVIAQKPDVVGLTATTPSFESARFIAQKLKEFHPAAVMVIGGAHITAAPYQAMESGCFDVGVIGEAEYSFLELLRHIQSAGLKGLDKLKGIAYKGDGKVIINSAAEFVQDLDYLPFPARHLLPPLSKYRPTPASYRRLPLAAIMTSRGCPCQCAFCDRAIFGNVYRQRSAENVLAEVDAVVGRYGAREIRFFDDQFTLDKERTFKICQGLKKRKIVWTCLTAVKSVTKELLKEMKASGCWQVLFGLESGDSRMLKALRKGNTREDNIQAVKWAREAGLSVRADFIVGTPGETVESLNKTLKFAIDMDLDYAHFNKFVPLPGTEIYRQLIASGYNFDFSQGASITDHGKFLYLADSITDKEYYRDFINRAHKRFYFRPDYILRRLFSIRTRDEFLGQLKGLLAIAGL